MFKKICMLVLGLTASIGLLTGCGKPSAQDLLSGLAEEENTFESATYDITMATELEISAQGVSAPISVDVEGTLEQDGTDITADNMGLHLKLNLDMSAAGQSADNQMELYLIKDGDEALTYSYESNSDIWTYTSTDAETPDAEAIEQLEELTAEMREIGSEMIEVVSEKAAFVDKESDYYDPEYDGYIVGFDLTGEDAAAMYDILLNHEGDLTDLMEKMSDEDISATVDLDSAEDLKDAFEEYADYINIYTVLYFNKDQQLAGMTLDFSEFDFESLISGIVEDLNLGVEVSVSVSKFEIGYQASNINETTVEVPDDVKEEAVEKDSVIPEGIPADALMPEPTDDLDGSISDGNDVSNDGDDASDGNDDASDDGDDGSDDGAAALSADGSIELLSYSETPICTIYMPEGFVYDDYLSSPEWGRLAFDDENDEFSWITVSGTADTILQEYMDDGTIPEDDEWFQNHSFTKELLGTVAGTDCYLVKHSYEWVDDGSLAEEIGVLIPYETEDSSGDTETGYIYIDFSEYETELNNDEIFAIVCEIMGE